MKNKITSFIMSVVITLILVIGIIIAYMIIENYNDSSTKDIEEFVSNVILESGKTEDKSENSDLNIDIENIKAIEKTQIVQNGTENNKYFYNQLSSEAKKFYDALEQHKEDLKTGKYELDFENTFANVLNKESGMDVLGNYFQDAVDAYFCEHPEVFYIDVTKMYLNVQTTTRGTQSTYKVTVNSGNAGSYLSDEFSFKEQIDVALQQLEAIKKYFIENKKADTYSNIKLVHDYLVNTIEYDTSISKENIYNIYGALIQKECVCEGYAKAFKYLLDGMDVPCVIVTGEATNSEGNTESHAWNYVQLDNFWYAVDVTWDDPVIVGGGVLLNSRKYKYFLKGENEFNQSHTFRTKFTEDGMEFTYPNLSKDNYEE